jgi:hypothetical protein
VLTLLDGAPGAAPRVFPVLHAEPRGRAEQVDPIKPALKAPGTERLKPKCDKPLSKFAFNLNLRRYAEAPAVAPAPCQAAGFVTFGCFNTLAKVGRCRLTL